MSAVNLENIHIVLQRPRYPENIGSAARAMCNMGIRHLSVVSPENYDLERVKKLATHVSGDIVAGITVHDDLSDALQACSYVVGTTARLGKQRQVIHSPEKRIFERFPSLRESSFSLHCHRLRDPPDQPRSNSRRHCIVQAAR